MIRYVFFFGCISYGLVVAAEASRQEITNIKKQKEALCLEQKRLLEESNAIQKMLKELAELSEEKKEKYAERQAKISRTLPLLARLERSNPLRMVIEPTMSQKKVRGIILVRFLISSIKSKMQQITMDLNGIKVQMNDLIIKDQALCQMLQVVENKKEKLSLVENKKIASWTKAELARLAKEEDATVLLEESRALQSRDQKTSSIVSALKGLPFRRLQQPVVGKCFKDAALQKKFSPHSRGVFFEAKKKAYVCAPARGKVVFKGPFRNHAEILIIDHGETTHTILIGIEKIDAEVGKSVYTGQKLGTMAGYGSGSLHLYLELRHKGEAIDPLPYFIVKNSE